MYMTMKQTVVLNVTAATGATDIIDSVYDYETD